MIDYLAALEDLAGLGMGSSGRHRPIVCSNVPSSTIGPTMIASTAVPLVSFLTRAPTSQRGAPDPNAKHRTTFSATLNAIATHCATA